MEHAIPHFNGRRIAPIQRVHGAEYIRFNHGNNSGAGAIGLGHHFGAQRIILLGYDCQYKGGKRHWHGDHPKGLGNAGKVDKWGAQFQKMADSVRDIEVVNATRETALTCFPKVTLEDALNERD